jgi:hypothetical protein
MAELIVVDHVLVTERDAKIRWPIRLMARSVAPSSSAPAFEVIAPPSKAATKRQPSTGAKSNSVGLHSVGIGDISCVSIGLCCRRNSADFRPRCTDAW